MNGLDIILGIPLIYAIWKGFREGIILQLAGIAGILVGVRLAFLYGPTVGGWMHLQDETAYLAGFLCIVIAALLGIGLLGRLVRGLFRLTGLGMFDQAGGVVLSVAKMAVILGVLLWAFDGLNREKQWVEPKTLRSSLIYSPLHDVSDFVFPYLRVIGKELVPDRELAGNQTPEPEQTGR